MAQNDFSAFLTDLKERNDIVSVVSSYVKLTRKGRHCWGLCPFHHEKTPSFSVNQDLQIYKCFGCGAAGDVIKFVQEVEHTDFNGAIQILADRVNMEIPKFGKEDTQAEKKRNELIEIMNAAQKFFVDQLNSPQGKPGMDYIKSRGLSEDIVKRFGLGYAPEGWENLKTYLLGLGFAENSIKETGLMSEKGDRYYDKFRNRVMYPICDDRGNIISYGGRKINPEDEPKYMNCPQTYLYNKSQTLYGLNIAKNFSHGTSLIIVEGYMDVIAMHEFGFNTAIASCGTSLTQQQARKIKRYVDKVYIGYDGDSAGQSATVRGLDILKETGLEVFVLSFPEGLDPDETLRQYGTDYFNEIIVNAKRLEEFKVERAFIANDTRSDEGKLKAAKEAIAVAASVDLDIEREKYIRMIAEKTGYSERAIINDINRISGKKSESKASPPGYESGQTFTRQQIPTQPKPKPQKPNNDYSAEARLVCLMARDKDCARSALSIANSGCFSDEICRGIVEAIQRIFEVNGQFGASEIVANYKGENADKVYDVLMTDITTLDIASETVAYANRVRSQYYNRKAKALEERANKLILEGNISNDECQNLLKEIAENRRKAKEIIKNQ